jgi:hypothetical protein
MIRFVKSQSWYLLLRAEIPRHEVAHLNIPSAVLVARSVKKVADCCEQNRRRRQPLLAINNLETAAVRASNHNGTQEVLPLSCCDGRRKILKQIPNMLFFPRIGALILWHGQSVVFQLVSYALQVDLDFLEGTHRFISSFARRLVPPIFASWSFSMN